MAELLDAYGRPVDLGLLKEEQAGPQFAGLRNIFSIAHPTVALTPDKLLGILRNAEIGDPFLYLEMAEEMEEKDLHYHSVLQTRKMAVSQLDLSVQAAGEDDEARADADFIRAVVLEGDLDLASIIYDVMDALGKGFSVAEIIWDTEGRYWIPQRIVWRDPRWFMFDWVSGEQVLVRTLRTEGPMIPPTRMIHTASGEIGIQPATAPLHPFKFITHIAKAKAGIPIRGGLARAAGWSYLFKNYVLKDWVTFAELYGQPLRVGKYGPGATDNDKNLLLRAVANMGTDASAVVPDSMVIELLENKQTTASSKLYEDFCEYIDKQISKAVLGQTLTTELPRGGGSRAAAQVHDAVRRDLSQDDARKLAATLNRDLVRPLIDLNRGTRRRYPKIAIGFPDEEDLKLLSDALAPFIDRGLPVEQKQILDKFGLEEPAPGAPLLHPAEKISGTEQSATPEKASADLSPLFTDVAGERRVDAAAMARRGRPRSAKPDLINSFVEKLREEYSAQMLAPIIRPLLAKMRKAKNYDELREIIVAAVPEMDPDRFVETLARAGFMVNLAGNLGINPSKPRRGR